MKRLGYVIVFCLSLSAAHAQEELAPLVKPEVSETQVMFKKSVWRRMHLKEKQNRPFFSKNGEIPTLLIEAVDEGLLTPYRSDSCINFMPDIIFVSNISVEREDNPFVGGGFNSGGFDAFDDAGHDGPLVPLGRRCADGRGWHSASFGKPVRGLHAQTLCAVAI